MLSALLCPALAVTPEALPVSARRHARLTAACDAGETEACDALADLAMRAFAASVAHAFHREAAPATYRAVQAQALAVSASTPEPEAGATAPVLDLPEGATAHWLDEQVERSTWVEGRWVSADRFTPRELHAWSSAGHGARGLVGPTVEDLTALDGGGFAAALVPDRRHRPEVRGIALPTWTGRFPVRQFLVQRDGLDVVEVAPTDHALCGTPQLLPSGHAVSMAVDDPRHCGGSGAEGWSVSWLDLDAGTARRIEGVGPFSHEPQHFDAAPGWLALRWTDGVDIYRLADDGSSARLERTLPVDRVEALRVSAEGLVVLERFDDLYVWTPGADAAEVVVEDRKNARLEDVRGASWIVSSRKTLEVFRGKDRVVELELPESVTAASFGRDDQELAVVSSRDAWAIDLAGRPWMSERAAWVDDGDLVVPQPADEIDWSTPARDLLVEGRVVRAGEPVAGAEVRYQPQRQVEGVEPMVTLSGADGTFRFVDAPRVPAWLYARDGTWRGTSSPDRLAALGGELELDRQPRVLQVRVLTPDGEAVSDALVVSRSGERVTVAHVADDGTHHVDVGKSRHLQLEVVSDTHGVAFVSDRLSGEGPAVLTRDVVVEPTERFETLVVDVFGAPVQGVELLDKRDRVVGVTDAEGRWAGWRSKTTERVRPADADHRWPRHLLSPQVDGATDVWTLPTRVSLPAVGDVWLDGEKVEGIGVVHPGGRMVTRELPGGTSTLVRWTDEGAWVAEVEVTEVDAVVDPVWTPPGEACTVLRDEAGLPLVGLSVDATSSLGPTQKLKSSRTGEVCLAAFPGDLTLAIDVDGLQPFRWTGATAELPASLTPWAAGAWSRRGDAIPLGVTFAEAGGVLTVVAVDPGGLWSEAVEPGWQILEVDGVPVGSEAELLGRFEARRSDWPVDRLRLTVLADDDRRLVAGPLGPPCTSITLERARMNETHRESDLTQCPVKEPTARLRRVPRWRNPAKVVRGTWIPVNPLGVAQGEAAALAEQILAGDVGGADPLLLTQAATDDPAMQVELLGLLALSTLAPRIYQRRLQELLEAGASGEPLTITAAGVDGAPATLEVVPGGVLIAYDEPRVARQELLIAGRDTLVMTTNSVLTGQRGVTLLVREEGSTP